MPKMQNFQNFIHIIWKKINPLIQRAVRSRNNIEFPVASRVDNDVWGSMLSEELDWEGYFEEYNKKYAPMWFNVIGDDLVDELSNGIVFVDKNKRYYIKKGIVFFKYVEINPKEYFLDLFKNFSYNAESTEVIKICTDIIKILKNR